MSNFAPTSTRNPKTFATQRNDAPRNVAAATRFVLNLAPISFEDAEVKIGVFNYAGRAHERDAHLRALREQHWSTHVFRRHESNKIISVGTAPNAPLIGDTSETLRLSEHLGLCAALIRNALLSSLARWGRQSSGYDPIRVLGTAANENLLTAALPQGLSCPDWLAVRPQFELTVRVVELDRRKPFVGLALETYSKLLIGMNCADLIAQDFPIDDLYVGRLVAENDTRLASYFQLAGRVQTVQDNVLLLDDARPELTSLNADEAFLDSNRHNFNSCLSHVFRNRMPEVKASLERQLAQFQSGPVRLEKLRSVVFKLGGRDLQIVPDVPLTIGSFLSEETRDFPPVQTAPRPVYVFNLLGTHTDNWHDRGLKQYGPYSAETLTPSRPRLCIICQKHRRGHVEQFLHKYLNGVQAQGGGQRYPPYPKGFTRQYGLEGISYEFFETDGDTANDYRRAAMRAIEQQTGGAKWDLALIQIDERFHKLYGGDNPHLVTKAAFLTQQIPTQHFEMETALAPNNQLGYILNNIALASYAKLGGVPWLMQADRTIAHELVIGLGSAHIGQGRLGKKERVVGITTVFSGDGNYWLSNLSRAVSADDYEEALLASLRKTISHVRRAMNWEEREHVRLIFHSFKPMKDAETNAVKTLMAELGDHDVHYAFLHVVQDHPYLLFDEAQEGVQDYQYRVTKGVFAPLRGRYLRLSNMETLLTLTGAQELKRPQDGMPRPLLLRLHRGSTFYDTSYLAKQVHTFASHSWQSFHPAPLPVTILYSQMVARMLGQLETVPRWNAEVMLGHIGTTRWFL